MQIGFDNEKYLTLQKEKILKRVEAFSNKLYLEMGGKLFDDLHAARVLPGFKPDVKIRLLESLKDKVEIIMCVSARDIEKNKVRADLGLSYDNEVLRLVDNFRSLGLYVSSIVITLFEGQPRAQRFANKLTSHGEKVYFHTLTKGYPNDVETIVSDEGYGKNPYIETTKPIVVVTAPGPNSGKLATSLSQLYHDYKRGIKSGYSKFETFPVWNLPLKHPVNVAYEAATADLKDVNMIDSYHFNAYGKIAVNYNRDLEVFPVLKNILKKITGEEIYESPTDMGVNCVAFAITDDDAVSLASKREIVRRYYSYKVAVKRGTGTQESVDRVKMLMNEMEIDKEILPPVKIVKQVADLGNVSCIGIELPDGQIIIGKTKKLLTAPGAALINALKVLTKIDDEIDLLSDSILEPILKMKKEVLKIENGLLTLDDVLIALSVATATNPLAKKCMQNIDQLKGCIAHSSYILPMQEEATLKKLGLFVSSEAHFENNELFI